ncbi:MAG: hypothetical protein HY675_13805 [Chloroflexi bacterium]|nr:hypothetical protein [Chloroflexota bacterium]
MSRDNTPKSKLAEKLRQVSVGPVGKVGFLPKAAVAPPALLLVVALSEAAPELVKAAVQGGADALVVRISTQADVEGEEPILRGVIAAAGDCPCGVLPQGSNGLGAKQLEAMKTIGFDFVSVSAHDSPAVLFVSEIGKMLALDYADDWNVIRALNELPVDCIQASIVTPEGFSKPFGVREALYLKALSMVLNKPVVVRGERGIEPKDIASLFEIGVEGLIVDATVTGSDKQTIHSVTSAYRQAIQAIDVTKRRRRADVVPTIPQPSRGQEEEEWEPD